MFRTLFRSFLATLAVVVAIGATPSDAFAKSSAKLEAAVEEASSKKMAWNRSVTLNETTKVFHVKGCRYFGGKNSEKMTLKAAKAEGGKPCKVCIK